MVPEGWSIKKLGEVGELQRGFDLPKEKRKKGSIPIISSGGVTGYHDTPKAMAPGVVTGRYGSIGDVFYIDQDYRPLNTALWVKDFHGNDEKFIYYLLYSFNFEKFSDKTGVPGVNRNDLHSIKVYTPPPSEQVKIGKILSTWDEAITYKKQLLANSKQQKKALMQQLLTGKKRLPGFGRPGKGGYSRKGLPNEWDFERIGNVAEEVADRNKGCEEVPVLSCSKYDGFVDSLKYFKKKVYSDDTSNYKLIRCGEFGFPANHVEEGSIGLQSTHDKGIVSPIYVVFRVDPSRIDPFFLYKVLKSDHYRQVFSASTSASVDRRGSLRWKQFSGIKVPLPSMEEQKSISTVIQLAEKEEELLEYSLDRLRSEKKALMQQLLTGKRRVTIDGAE